jgi:hypothetical protein
MFAAQVFTTLGPQFFADLDQKIQSALQPRMANAATRLLAAELRRGDDQRPYTVEVDDRNATPAQFIQARRRIRITFIQEAVRLAVSVMKGLMEREIGRSIEAQKSFLSAQGSTSGQSWTNTREVQARVRLFYGGDGIPIREISGAADIETFAPGDVVFLVPAYGTQVYANASKYGGSGFMRRSSAAIRRAVKVTKTRSPISIAAVRSRAVYYKLAESPMHRPDGTLIDPTTPWAGSDSAWCVVIRYRKAATFR